MCTRSREHALCLLVAAQTQASLHSERPDTGKGKRSRGRHLLAHSAVRLCTPQSQSSVAGKTHAHEELRRPVPSRESSTPRNLTPPHLHSRPRWRKLASPRKRSPAGLSSLTRKQDSRTAGRPRNLRRLRRTLGAEAAPFGAEHRVCSEEFIRDRSLEDFLIAASDVGSAQWRNELGTRCLDSDRKLRASSSISKSSKTGSHEASHVGKPHRKLLLCLQKTPNDAPLPLKSTPRGVEEAAEPRAQPNRVPQGLAVWQADPFPPLNRAPHVMSRATPSLTGTYRNARLSTD